MLISVRLPRLTVKVYFYERLLWS